MTKGDRKKAKWAKLRKQNADKRAEALEGIRQRASARTKKPAAEFRELKAKPSMHDVTINGDRSRSLPSKDSEGSGGFGKPKERYRDPELAAREAKAQEETERKKKMVAPLYNKSGLHYVGDAPPEIIKNLGRKV